jgi:hypothetical protein
MYVYAFDELSQLCFWQNGRFSRSSQAVACLFARTTSSGAHPLQIVVDYFFSLWCILCGCSVFWTLFHSFPWMSHVSSHHKGCVFATYETEGHYCANEKDQEGVRLPSCAVNVTPSHTAEFISPVRLYSVMHAL